METSFKVITLFPDFIKSLEGYSIIGRAINKGIIDLDIIDLRNFGIGKHHQVDDKPYGGGIGMLIRVDVMDNAIQFAKSRCKSKSVKTILLSPQGKQFVQKKSLALSSQKEIIIICGHYEGFDHRIRYLVDEEISIGPYILTGGEIPAMVLIDSISRLKKGVLGKTASCKTETFSTVGSKKIIEYPQYTRPQTYKNRTVPSTLVSGNHKEIKKWQDSHTKIIS